VLVHIYMDTIYIIMILLHDWKLFFRMYLFYYQDLGLV
jgi:hypothetical protein